MSGTPAKLKGLHRAAGEDLRHAQQEMKLLRPICKVCAPDSGYHADEWWLECPHDPYVGERGEVVTDTEYEPELDAEGNEIGRVVASKSQRVVLRPFPNYVQILASPRVSNGDVNKAKEQKGYIFPSALVSPAFPDGVANSCEYRNCFWQSDLKTYASGTFCQEREAILVAMDASGVVREVHDPRIRQRQVDDMRIRLAAAQK